MKSAFSILHITDLHISDWLPSGYEMKIERAVDAALTAVDSEMIFVVISGDIANTGNGKEYDIASKVISFLIKTLKSRCSGNVDFVLAPGNHDIFQPPESVPSERNEAERAEQLAKMEDFFCFSLCMGIDWESEDYLVSDYVLPQDVGFSGVRFCCLNTAPFSTHAYDKGAHVLPREAFHAIRKDSPYKMSVVVAHHCPDWLEDSPRLELEREALNSIDLLLVGHEHRGRTVLTGQLNKEGLPIFRGGTFSLDDEKECTFTVINIAPLQAGNYSVEETRLAWNSSSRLFVTESVENLSLEMKGLVPKPRKEYIEALSNDIGRGEDFFSKSFSFPRLRRSASLLPEDDAIITTQSVDIKSEDDFFSQLEEWDCMVISGTVGSGKSCLSRAIYIECTRRGYIPILIHPDNSTSAFSVTLDSLIGNQYGLSPVEKAAFQQAPREKKILIADDFDRIKKKRKKEPERLIHQMLGSFGKVIIMVSSGYEVTSHALIEGDAHQYITCGTFEICACTKQVRRPLVMKLCQTVKLDENSTERMVRAVDRAVLNHTGLFELTPAFVTQYVDYFLANRTELLSQDELPFKQIFDSNIRRDILEADRHLNHGQMDSQLIDAVVATLQDVALRMHTQRVSVLDIQTVSEVIRSYAEAHDLDLTPKNVLDVALQARILIKLDNGYSCMFSSLYVHAYFVAKRIDAALDLGEEDAIELIDHLLDEICFPINEEVIVFLTQMRISVDFPIKLIERADQILGGSVDQEPFDPQVHKALRALLGLDLTALDEKRASNIAVLEDCLEDGGHVMHEGIEYRDYYDNDRRQLEEPLIRSFMAVKYADLAAGYLVKHFAMIPQRPKRLIREALYRIPQSAANIILSDVDGRLDELAIKVAHSFPDDFKSNDDADLFAHRFVAAVCLCLSFSIIGTVFAHASEGQAIVAYLLKEDGDSFGNNMGKLMALSFAGKSESFVGRAVSMAESARKHCNHIQLIAIKMLVNQYLLDNPRIKLGDKHRLLNGVFEIPGDSSSAILGLRRHQ